jgi:hypothetical protein
MSFADGTAIQYKLSVVSKLVLYYRVSIVYKSILILPAMPLVTQSDPGSENNGIANGHTYYCTVAVYHEK